MEKFFHIHRNKGHNSHGCNKFCLGYFNGSLYIFSFTRSMGKKWTLEVLLIQLRIFNYRSSISSILRTSRVETLYSSQKVSLINSARHPNFGLY